MATLCIKRWRQMMSVSCTDCAGVIEVSDDCIPGEIISCPDCGLDYVIEEDGSGTMLLRELVIEGEDWGE